MWPLWRRQTQAAECLWRQIGQIEPASKSSAQVATQRRAARFSHFYDSPSPVFYIASAAEKTFAAATHEPCSALSLAHLNSRPAGHFRAGGLH